MAVTGNHKAAGAWRKWLTRAGWRREVEAASRGTPCAMVGSTGWMIKVRKRRGEVQAVESAKQELQRARKDRRRITRDEIGQWYLEHWDALDNRVTGAIGEVGAAWERGDEEGIGRAAERLEVARSELRKARALSKQWLYLTDRGWDCGPTWERWESNWREWSATYGRRGPKRPRND